MQRQPKPTEKQVELIKELNKLKHNIWNSKSTDEIIEIAKKAIEISENVSPTSYLLADGTERINERGKSLRIQVLKYDIESLEQNNSTPSEDEKLNVVLSIQLLIRVFGHLNNEELIDLFKM